MKGRGDQPRAYAELWERPIWERKVVTIGFTGTYDAETAESDGIALAGKQNIRFKSRLRLLVPD